MTSLLYEVVDVVEPDQPYQDEVEGDDVVQQARHDQDQNPGEKGDDRRDVIDFENHFQISKNRENDRACNNRHTAFMHGR